MSEQVYWVFKIGIKEGELENFKALMNEMVAETQANESGALMYEWFISEDGSICHMFEKYADSGAVLTHLRNFGVNFASRLMEVAIPKGMTVYGEPDETARKALLKNGAVILAPLGGFSR